ncbi:unnamed protein product [Pleuronectes platessa]|uniref:Uncharacterized protein n=1 Tax=Pleuronectes platessa TaxID=8262 RepID=A0A9N7U7D0_PLEPL|nr:unnamed protein product [Pleuronectes platessa]
MAIFLICDVWGPHPEPFRDVFTAPGDLLGLDEEWRTIGASRLCPSGHTILQRPPERISPPMGRMAASRRQLPSWQRIASEGKGRQGTPHRSVREAEMLAHKHTVALLGTHGTSAAASGCTDSWQLRFVFASWESWHCHFINYLWLLLGKKASNELFRGCSCKLDFHPRDPLLTYDCLAAHMPPTY